MENSAELLINYIEELRGMEDLKTELAIEEIIEDIKYFDEKSKKTLYDKLLKKLEYEQSNKMIHNTLMCIKSMETDNKRRILDIGNINETSQNPKLIIELIKIYFNDNENFYDNLELMKRNLGSNNSELQNYIIKIIGNKKINHLSPDLLLIFDDVIEILKNETYLFQYSGNIDDLFYSLEFKRNNHFIKFFNILPINSSNLPDIKEYNKKIKKYISDIYLSHDPSNYCDKNNTLISIKEKMIRDLLNKVNILINCFISMNSALLFSKLKDLIKITLPIVSFKVSSNNLHSKTLSYSLYEKISNFSNISNISNISEFSDMSSISDLNDNGIKKFKSLSYYYLGKYGGKTFEEEGINFLYQKFKIEEDEEIKISIIHAMGNTRCNSAKKILFKIASDNIFYFYALSALLKIGGEDIENYIIKQLNSGNSRRILFTTFFIPYLNNEIFRTITINLLKEYKQPLIIRQSLWIIRKIKIIDALPHVINKFFETKNDEIRNEARSIMLDFGQDTLKFLEKRINYYKSPKKNILSDIMNEIENLIN